MRREAGSGWVDLVRHMPGTPLNWDRVHVRLIEPEELAELPFYYEAMDFTPFDVLTRQALIQTKIEHAKQLMRTTCLPIHEIASDLNDSNAFYFSKQFKDYVGLSPRAFRNAENLGASTGRGSPRGQPRFQPFEGSPPPFEAPPIALIFTSVP